VIEAVIRNEGGAKTAGTTGARAVHYGGQTNDNDIGVGPDNDFDDVDRDDTGAYGRYQEAPQYDGYQGAPQEEEITKLLHLQPGESGEKSDDSARAVAGYDDDDNAGAGSRRNSADLGDEDTGG